MKKVILGKENRVIWVNILLLCAFIFVPSAMAITIYDDGQVHNIDATVVITEQLYVFGVSPQVRTTVNFLPGALIQGAPGDLLALDYSTVNIYGGIIPGELVINLNSIVTAYGSEFALTDSNGEIIEVLNPTVAEITYAKIGGYQFYIKGVNEDGSTLKVTLESQSAVLHLIWEQEIEIESEPQYDFGNVAVGQSGVYQFLINNIGYDDLEVELVLDPLGSSDFVITSPPEGIFTLPPESSVDVIITFSPSVEDVSVFTTLAINSNDRDEPQIQISLTGFGIPGEVPPSEQVQAILSYFNDSAYGPDPTLFGNGPGNSSSKRLNALYNMIEAAGDLIDAGDYAQAIEQLEAISKKTDGMPKPQDFVTGEAVAGLNEMIEALIADLMS